MRHEALNLCGKLSLGGLVGAFSRCEVVVSNDSGPLHLAVAVGTPTVGIYWGPNLVNAGPSMRSQHRPALSWTDECPVCGAGLFGDDCGHTESIVGGVPVEEVSTHALDLLRGSLTAPRWSRARPHPGHRTGGLGSLEVGEDVLSDDCPSACWTLSSLLAG